MNSQYFWLIDQVNLNTYRIKWAPGLENMADYFTKHFAEAHHCNVPPFYVHMHNSPRLILKVNKKVSDKIMSDEKVSVQLRGCVNIRTNARTISLVVVRARLEQAEYIAE